MSITDPFSYTDTIRLLNQDYYLAYLCYDFILLIN